ALGHDIKVVTDVTCREQGGCYGCPYLRADDWSPVDVKVEVFFSIFTITHGFPICVSILDQTAGLLLPQRFICGASCDIRPLVRPTATTRLDP
ncbi:hypothetical protein ACLOJK_025683, partial [Asimina triloba]